LTLSEVDGLGILWHLWAADGAYIECAIVEWNVYWTKQCQATATTSTLTVTMTCTFIYIVVALRSCHCRSSTISLRKPNFLLVLSYVVN